jgi:hypothetical protein
VIVCKNDFGAPHYTAILKDAKIMETVPADTFSPEIPEGVVSMDLLDLAPEPSAE